MSILFYIIAIVAIVFAASVVRNAVTDMIVNALEKKHETNNTNL